MPATPTPSLSSPARPSEHPVRIIRSRPLLGSTKGTPISALDLRVANRSLDIVKSSFNHLPTPTSHIRTPGSLPAVPHTPIQSRKDHYSRTRSASKVSRASVRSNSRKRKKSSWLQGAFFYGLVIGSQLFLMAVPITLLIVIQAYDARRPMAAPLVAFIVVLFFAFLSAVPSVLLGWKYQRRLIKWGEKMEQEVDRCRTLIREKNREIEYLGAFTSRLRRSLSRGSKRREASIAAALESVGAGASNTTGRRSVSRGRTGRSHTLEEVLNEGFLELDSGSAIKLENVPPQKKRVGSVSRARQTAVLQLQGIFSPLNKPLPPDPPVTPARPSSLQRWGDTLTITGSPPSQGPLSGPIMEMQQLQSPEIFTDEAESPPYQVTSLDRYTVPETLRQGLERSVQDGRRGVLASVEAEGAGRRLGHGQNDESARLWSRSASRLDLDFDSVSEELDEGDDADVTEIVRGGNGGYGSEQSDDNFEKSHELDDDAESMTNSLKEKKKAASIHTVIEWKKRARADERLAGIDGEIVIDNRGTRGGEEHTIVHHEKVANKGDERTGLKNSWSEDEVRRRDHHEQILSESLSMEEARKNFQEWHAKRLAADHKRSRSDTPEQGGKGWM